MRRESQAARKRRAQQLVERLRQQYAEAPTALDFRTPLEMLVATILSAQCTDAVVNQVTPALFARYPTARHYAEADPAELETMIRPTGFFRNKTKSLIGMGQALVAEFGGEVPGTMAEMLRLPGVARKTANVVLQNAFGVVEGVVVDTHVKRITYRLGLTTEADPQQVEQDLIRLLPREEWRFWGHAIILHGRETCPARKPKCGECVVEDLCPKVGME